MLFLAFSTLTACSSIKRPDTNLCVVNAVASHLTCYNMLRDYQDDGMIKPDAKPTIIPVDDLSDLNKFITTDPEGFARLKLYVKELRTYYQNGCKP
jgi:hypothetical protein